MVDAVGIEVVAHLLEAVAEPLVVVLGHFLPVIGGEAPVLSVGGKSIGRSAGLSVHVEEMRIDPRIDASAADTDGDVALEGDAVGMGIVNCLLQLDVQMILDEVVECDVGVTIEAVDELGAVGDVFPTVKVGCAEHVAEVAERRIGTQPVIVFIKECLECRRSKCLGTLLGIDEAQIVPLGLCDALVVNLRQSVQLLLQGVELLHLLLVAQFAHGIEIDVGRMQGKGGVGIVRVGVCPCTRHGGVVDGQELNDAHAGALCPIDHDGDVSELADAEALLAA